MTASHEQALLARARELADTSAELGDAIAVTILGGARAAGLDPAAYAPLTGAALALGADRVAIYRAVGPALANDVAFLSAIADAEDDARDLLNAASALADQAITALDILIAKLAELAVALGAGDDRAAARAAAIRARIRLCEGALEVLAELGRRLRHAISRLQAAPAALGETYEAVYDLIRVGGRMPHEGRWITGEDPAPQIRPARPGSVNPSALAERLLSEGWIEGPGKPCVYRVLRSPDGQDDVLVPLRPDYSDYPARLSEALSAIVAWQLRRHRAALASHGTTRRP